MVKKSRKLLIFFNIICYPFLIVSSLDWLKVNGIAPCWPVIFLLPFSISNPLWKSAIAAISLGLFIDSFTVNNVSYIPSLLLVSLLWSQYRLRKQKIEFFLNIGLMAIFGTVIVGFTIWIQKIILFTILRNNWFHSWSIYVVIAEVIITGLVAPFVSTWLFLLIKKTN